MTRVVMIHTSPTTGFPPDHVAGEGGPECLTCHPPAFATLSFVGEVSPEYASFVGEFRAAAAQRVALLIEERIRLAVRPRPRWLPERAWRWVVARVLVVEEMR